MLIATLSTGVAYESQALVATPSKSLAVRAGCATGPGDVGEVIEQVGRVVALVELAQASMHDWTERGAQRSGALVAEVEVVAACDPSREPVCRRLKPGVVALVVGRIGPHCDAVDAPRRVACSQQRVSARALQSATPPGINSVWLNGEGTSAAWLTRV